MPPQFIDDSDTESDQDVFPIKPSETALGKRKAVITSTHHGSSTETESEQDDSVKPHAAKKSKRGEHVVDKDMVPMEDKLRNPSLSLSRPGSMTPLPTSGHTHTPVTIEISDDDEDTTAGLESTNKLRVLNAQPAKVQKAKKVHKDQVVDVADDTVAKWTFPDAQDDKDEEPEELKRDLEAEEAERRRKAAIEMRGSSIFDTWFTTGDEAQNVALLPVCRQPEPSRVQTRLLKHQLQALRWMVEMEHPKPPVNEQQRPVQLWTHIREEDGSALYFNLGTKRTMVDDPHFRRGGILADDMGLGKTLATLALIRCDPTGHGVIDDPDDEVDDHFCKTTLIEGTNSFSSVSATLLHDGYRDLMQHDRGDASLCNYHVYHGKEARVDKATLKSCDIVITTYQQVARDYVVDRHGEPVHKKRKYTPEALAKLKNGTLFRIAWRRIVLDEAHIIRNHNTAGHKACVALHAERRWALSGTPLINQPDDLQSLLAFTRLCQPFDDIAAWRQIIKKPLKNPTRHDDDGTSSRFLQAIVQSTTLRRTKETRDVDGQPIVKLPPISIYTHRIKLDRETRLIYDTVQGAVKDRVQEMINSAELHNQFANVLVMLLRLRQLACATALCPEEFIDAITSHARLCDEVDNGPKMTREEKTALQQILYENRTEDCPICLGTLDEPRITPCRHFFCVSCLDEHFNKSTEDKREPHCPMCRAKIHQNMLVQLDDNMVIDQEEGEDENGRIFRAQKAEELVRLLKLFPPGEKSLVFSQWTRHLRHLGHRLTKAGITHIQYDGSMDLQTRDAVIDRFRSHDGPQVLLLSLACGALGLNLVNANNVFLANGSMGEVSPECTGCFSIDSVCEKKWQSQIEQQAIDRCYRIGQKKPVRVYQIVAENTIEDRVLDIQDRKKKMIGEAFAGTKGAMFERKSVESRYQDIVQALGL